MHLIFDKLKIDSPITIDSVEKISDTPDSKGQYSSRINFTPYISDSIEIAKKMLVEEDICIDDVECSFGKYTQLAKEIVVKNSHLFFSSESFTMHKIVWKYVVMQRLFWMKQNRLFQK